MSQSIITNTGIATGGRVFNIALGVVATALITRTLGPDRFGLYILLLSLGAIVQLSADFGLYLTLTREIAEHPDKKNEIFSQIISLRLTLLLLVFLISVLVVFFVPALKTLTIAFIIMSVGLSFQSLSQLFMGLYQYHQVIWRATAGDVAGRLVQILGIVIVSFYAVTVNAMVAVLAISMAVAYFVHWQLLPGKNWRLVSNWPAWRGIIKTSWPLGVMLFVNSIYFRVDTLILSVYQPTYEVGWYGAAYRIVESALFFPAMFGGLLLPRISEVLAKKKKRKAGQYINEGVLLLLAAAVYVFVAIQLFNRDIVGVIAGASFSPAAPLLKILALALAIMFLGNLFGFALVAMKKQMLLLKLYIGLVFFNVLANLVFIPLYGAQAAAWSTVVTELLATAYAGYQVNKVVGLSISVAVIFRIAVAGGVSALLVSLLLQDFNVIGEVVVFTGLYGVLMYVMKVIRSDKLSLLIAIKSSGT